jgi:hypothetical protein
MNMVSGWSEIMNMVSDGSGKKEDYGAEDKFAGY